MAQQLPCPNPVCTHVFSPADLQSGTAVACPRCGFKVRGLAAPAPAPRPASSPPAAPQAKPAARPAAPPPTRPAVPPAARPAAPPARAVPQAKPAAPAARPSVPVARPAAAPVARPAARPGGYAPEDIDVELVETPLAEPAAQAGAEAFDVGPLVRPRQTRRGFRLSKLLVILTALLIAGGVVLVGGYYVLDMLLADQGGLRGLTGTPGRRGYVGVVRNAKNVDEPVYRLALDEADWSIDREIRQHFGAIDARRHNSEDVWFAVCAKDYGMHRPRDAELVRQAIAKLEAHFGDALELAAKTEPITFAGKDGQSLTFKGQSSAVNWMGDCTILFVNGFALWIYVAAPEHETAQRWTAALQKDGGFALAVDRRGWREQPTPRETFTGLGGRLSVTAPEGVWEKHNAKNEEERGVLFLYGRYLQEKDNRKNATVLVYTIDPQPDLKQALKAARDHVEARKKEENTTYKLDAAPEVGGEGQTEAGAALSLGNRSGRVVDLCLKIGSDPKRYLLIAVINEPDACYVLRCDCTWDSRQIWRQDFLDLLRTARLAPAKKG